MKKFLKSFVYAFRGIVFCIVNERNMRVHMCFTAWMFGYLKIYDFFVITKAEFAVLFGLCGLVMSLEAVNTAIEKVVDLAADGRLHELAKISKDAAAGAVLISALASVCAGISIMYQPEAFSKMFDYYKENPAMIAVLAVTFIISAVFALAGPYGIAGFFGKRDNK